MTRAVPLVAATMIVKNEAQNLPASLASLHELVDEVVIYDTGSTDGTPDLARAAGARVLHGFWDDDFARARNAALEMTQARWALIVDADECVVADPGALRTVLTTGVDAFDLLLVKVLNVTPQGRQIDSMLSVRLARRERTRWRGTVHEQLVPRDGGPPDPTRRAVFPPDLVHLRHSGYADLRTAQDKAERNLALAQRQLDTLVAARSVDRDAAAWVLLDLGRSLLGLGRLQDAVDAFETLRDLVGSGLHRSQATAMLAQVLLDEGGLDEAALVLEAELRAGGDADPRFCDWLRAQALAHLGEPTAALALLAGVDAVIDPVGNDHGIRRVELARAIIAPAAGEADAAIRAELATLGDRAAPIGGTAGQQLVADSSGTGAPTNLR